jgi:carbonic anhydrase
MRADWMVLVVQVLVVAAVPISAHAQWKTPWSYKGPDGPEHWGKLDPDYAACTLGKAQSPVDIRSPEPADLPSLRFVDVPGPLTVINNGYTAVRVNYATGNGNLLIVGDKQYELTQFHFHHPSEEYIHGRPYAMGLHLMYKASDGAIAAVAVMLHAGRANPTIRQLWAHMPATPGKEHTVPGVDINPAGLLPHDAAYYTYQGSLTAPPCTEGVTWFVLKTPEDISARQIEDFAKLYPHDVRPVHRDRSPARR